MKRESLFSILAGAMLFSACTVGPNYKRPSAVAPPVFKEQPPPNFKEAEAAGWKEAQPGDAYLKGKWWEVYNDPALSALEEQVSLSNQNVAQAEAQYVQAKTGVRVARAALFPTLTAGLSVTESRAGGAAGGAGGGAGNASLSSPGASGTRTFYNLPFDISWEPDLWGSI